MANVAVINAIGITSYAFAALGEGESAFDRALAYSNGLPELKSLVLFTDSPRAEQVARTFRPDGQEVKVTIRTGGWNLPRLFKELQEVSREYDDLFYFYGDCPLLDSSITERMYRNHRKYFSEYTFADGYPLGMTPEIVRVERLPAVAKLLQESDGSIDRDSLFTVVQRDINAFDVETEISPKDLRLLRAQLHCDSLRNFRLTSGVIEAGGRDEKSILEIVEHRQELLRTVPAYFEVQVTNTLSQSVSYLPAIDGIAQAGKREMTTEQFAGIVGDVSKFTDDAVISLSLWGEPALHSKIAGLVEEALRHEGIQLLIETSGIGWKKEVLESMRELPWERITWIVDLDASNKELYELLRGPGWEEAQATSERLMQLFPDRVHVQAVRMQENEADLETFYRYWKERTSNVIIQKYDWCCGRLPQKKVTDLSPLRRLPCWHLKRDMIVLLDGSVLMCREDLAREHVLGNAFEESLADIWTKGEPHYLRHVHQDYPELCTRCDEYYTYNF